MNNLIKLFSLVVLSTIIACSPKGSAIEEINSLEEQLYGESSTVELDLELSKEVSAKYMDYVTSYPEDTLAPVYLFKAAEVFKNNHFYGKSIELFEQVQTDYPDFRKTPHAMFMRAFILEENLGEIESAHKVYSEFVTAYPQHELVAAARFSIKNLGRDEAEIILEFEQNIRQQERDAAAAKGEEVSEEETHDHDDHEGHDH